MQPEDLLGYCLIAAFVLVAIQLAVLVVTED